MSNGEDRLGQVIIDGLNMFDVITILDKKKRRYIKVALDDLERFLNMILNDLYGHENCF